jgi:hypothetical protein
MTLGEPAAASAAARHSALNAHQTLDLIRLQKKFDWLSWGDIAERNSPDEWRGRCSHVPLAKHTLLLIPNFSMP